MRKSFLFGLITFSLLSPQYAHASACAPEAWMYQTVSASTEPYFVEELSRLQLNGVMATGLEGPEPLYFIGPYQVKGTFKGKSLQFEFMQGGKAIGSAEFQIPAQYREFQNDLRWVMPHESPVKWSESQSEINVFKELRLQSSLVFNPELQKSLNLKEAPKVSLTLFGHGNRCLAAENYTLWRMEWNYQQGQDSETVVARGNLSIVD